jgi:hypothetical protein
MSETIEERDMKRFAVRAERTMLGYLVGWRFGRLSFEIVWKRG